MFKTSTEGKAGSARMIAIARENKLEIERLKAHMVAGLKRPATAGELIDAELIASTFVKAQRLRACGRDDYRERTLLRDLMRSSAFASVPEPSPAERQHGAAVAEAYAQHDRQAGLAALRGHADAGDAAPDGATATDGVSNAV
jgi:hypothetical protein